MVGRRTSARRGTPQNVDHFLCCGLEYGFLCFCTTAFASIYKLANPYWLALANAMISLSLGILLYKKQRFEPLSSSEQQENPKEETV